MASGQEPFRSPLGRPCTVYVEHAGAERIAPGQEQTIEGAGGIVVKDPNQAVVVVVIKRGSQPVEQRIRDTHEYRKTNSIGQAVVDFGWIYECIRKSELQGPPDWGGYLLRPADPVISKEQYEELGFTMFGRPEHGPLFRGEPTASDAMQVDQPLTTAQPGRSNGVDAQDPARGRRLLPQVSGENGAESFASAWGEVRRIVAELDQAGSFRTFTSGDMLTLIHDLHQVEANTEPAVGWWQSFTARRAEETPSEKQHSIDSWREFYRNRSGLVNRCVNMLLRAGPSSENLRPLQEPTSRTTRYRNRSRSNGRDNNERAQGDGGETLATAPSTPGGPVTPSVTESAKRRGPGRPRKHPVNGAQKPKKTRQRVHADTQPRANPPRKSSSRYRSGNQGGESVQSQGGTVATEGPQSVLYDDSDIFDAMQTFAGWDASELLNEGQALLTRFDAVLKTSVPREGAANPALQGRDGLSWTLWTQENWDIIAAGAIILGNQVAGVDKSPTESDPSCLSKRGEPHTSTDYDEVSDFVTTQIKARELVEGGETIVISKEFFWKAFAILHKADRSWNDWQGYYITNAGDINRSARTRLKLQRERDLTSETAVILESEQYNSSPLLSLKRPYEGASDDRAPKQLRA